MEFKNDHHKLSAHIFIADSEEAGVVCSSLKKLGVSGESHQLIETFWEKMISTPSNFAIIDIRLMNSNGRVFIDHPMYKNGTTEVIIFHREDDYPLLKLVEEKNFFDFIPESVNYDIFLRHTVSKLRKIVTSEARALESISEIEHLENRLKRTQNELVQASEIFQKKMQFNKFMECFWSSKNSGKNFLDSFIESCEKTDLIKKAVIFFTGNERTVIKTVRSDSSIVEVVPPVAVKKMNKPLNKDFIEKTCLYIAKDRLGPEGQLIRVSDCNNEKKYLIGVNVSGIEKKNINQILSFFDNFLSSEYQSFVNEKNGSMFVDEYTFMSQKASGFYLRVNLHSLLDYIKKKPSVFLMKEFSKNFFVGLRRFVNEKTKIINVSPGVCVLSNCDKNIEIKVKEYFNNFDYWSYFEDCDENFSRLVEPDISALTESEIKNIFLFGSSKDHHMKRAWG